MPTDSLLRNGRESVRSVSAEENGRNRPRRCDGGKGISREEITSPLPEPSQSVVHSHQIDLLPPAGKQSATEASKSATGVVPAANSSPSIPQELTLPYERGRERNYRQLSISPSPAPQRTQVALCSAAAAAAAATPEAAAGKAAKAKNNDPVTWASLPQKSQLAILTLARLSEPLTQTSLHSYLYYQLGFFDPSLAPSAIAAQAGILLASFAAAQAVTSVFWGQVADAPWAGRKAVLIVGLCGSGLGSLGYGFAASWGAATGFRVMSGALNGNVGVMRTMISEIVKEKKYQSRAFLLLPMCFNIGVIIGPLLGGLLADPLGNYPGVFGPGTALGGADGVWWMKKWPYSLPNTLSAIYLFSATLLVFLGLEETQEKLRDSPDLGLRMGRYLRSIVWRLLGGEVHDYASLRNADHENADYGNEDFDLDYRTPITPATPLTPFSPAKSKRSKPKLPFRRIWTSNVKITLISHFLLAMGVGTFNSLWFLFLSTPRFDPSHPIPPAHVQKPPFVFTGGLGLPPSKVGLAMAVLGTIGITLQLAVYPTASARLGTLRSYQLVLLLFPIVYFMTPYLSLIPSTTTAPAAASGVLVWLAIGGLLSMQVLARTFALPANTILINNSSPHPSVLGTVHGIGQSVSSAARTLGPVTAGWLFGMGLSHGIVGIVFWIMAGFAVLHAIASLFLREGSGHEIFLEGEKIESETDGEVAPRRGA